ncbi:hypothetical protein KJ840_04250 [Patescibacteria group bacterium]|nr:hypothetical protein [Patescibacteria group bacterium]
MEQPTEQPTYEPQPSSKKFWPIIIAVVTTVIIVVVLMYFWQATADKQNQKIDQTELQMLQQKVDLLE